MKIKCATWLYLAILSSTFFALVNGLNFFTATVDPPDSQYSQLLSGNDVFENVYSTFNSTGLILLGSALLLSSGFLALPFLPDVPNKLEDSLHQIRNGPLGFIPKPGFGKTKDAILSNPPYYTTAKPVVYSFDLDENIAKKNYNEAKLTSQGSNFDLGHLPGPPYKIDASDQQPKLKHQVYINVDHSKQSGFQPKISTSSNFQNNHRVSQVIEPVVNTITDAIKKGFTDYNSHKQYVKQAADRRTVDPSYSYDSSNQNEEIINNEISNNYNYGFPLDYYDYDTNYNTNDIPTKKPNQMTQAATSITPKYFDVSEKDHYAMEKLRNLKKMYTPSPVIRHRFGRPQLTTKRSEHSYYVQPPKMLKQSIKHY